MPLLVSRMPCFISAEKQALLQFTAADTLETAPCFAGADCGNWLVCWLQVLLVLGIGGAIGVVGGGWLGQVLYNRRKWSMSVFIGASGSHCFASNWRCLRAGRDGRVGAAEPELEKAAGKPPTCDSMLRRCLYDYWDTAYVLSYQR